MTSVLDTETVLVSCSSKTMSKVIERLELPIACSSEMPIKDRVNLVKDLINEACTFFLSGHDLQGTEAFGVLMLDRIEDVNLLEKKNFDISEVGVHPDNREKSGLVPMDAQDLLLLMYRNGFNPSLLQLLAAYIPATPEGDQWREVNERIARESNGFLPPARSSMMKIVTCCGSHTTAAFRIAKYAAKSAHQELDSGNGTVSMARITERKPSLRKPLENGMEYTVIHADLVTACPQLMHVLSRTGNVSHGVHRVHTTLQMALAVFRAFKQNESKDVCKAVACQAQTPEFVDNFDTLYTFVKAHCGGDDGRYLINLEEFERSVHVKRTISFETLGKLAAIKLHSASGARYVPALIKTYLAAPVSKVKNGVAEILAASDFASLTNKHSKLHASAVDASNLMVKSSVFLEAYASKDAKAFRVAIDTLEQRLVMFVHKIKCQTRKEYSSTSDVLSDFYNEAKTIDPSLPKWNLVQENVASAPADVSHHFDELNEAGTISDAGLAHKGFKVGTYVELKKKAAEKKSSKDVFQIVSLADPAAVITKAVMKDGTLGNEEFRVPRVELILEYKTGSHDKMFIYEPRLATKDIIKDAILSDVKTGILTYVNKHSTDAEIQCVGDKAQVFPKTKKVCFVAFSKTIFSTASPKPLQGLTYYIGHHDAAGYLYMSVMTTPVKDMADEEKPIIPFAIVLSMSKTKDDDAVNMELEIRQHRVKLYDGTEIVLHLPCVVNTRPFAAGEACRLSYMENSQIEPPAPKVGKAAKGKGGKGGKSKGK